MQLISKYFLYFSIDSELMWTLKPTVDSPLCTAVRFMIIMP